MSDEPPSLSPIGKLTATHDFSGFDCGKEPLNHFLQRHALASQSGHASVTYVACRGRRVVGYYSLATGSVMHEHAPERVKKGQPKYDIPVMLLARLAVDASEQGRGLLKDALLRTAQAAEIAGIRALLVHAKDDEARRWYEQFDFEPSPTDPLHLFLVMKDLLKLLRSG